MIELFNLPGKFSVNYCLVHDMLFTMFSGNDFLRRCVKFVIHAYHGAETILESISLPVNETKMSFKLFQAVMPQYERTQNLFSFSLAALWLAVTFCFPY